MIQKCFQQLSLILQHGVQHRRFFWKITDGLTSSTRDCVSGIRSVQLQRPVVGSRLRGGGRSDSKLNLGGGGVTETGCGLRSPCDLDHRYDGKEYSSSNVYPGELPRGFDTEDAAESVLDGYDTGDTVTAYVPPESPDDAYIKHESSNKPFLIIGIGVLFVVGGVRSFL